MLGGVGKLFVGMLGRTNMHFDLASGVSCDLVYRIRTHSQCTQEPASTLKTFADCLC